jgi:hypothetical protein
LRLTLSADKKDLSTDYTDYHGFSFVGFSGYRLPAVIWALFNGTQMTLIMRIITDLVFGIQ